MEYHSDPITARKAALRARARAFLRQAGPEQTAAWGRAMAEYLTKRELWQQAGAVFCFVSTAREPSTRPLLELALAQGKTLCVPRTGPEGFMEAVPITSLNQLVPARFGLLEPAPDLPALDPGRLDLVIAPCLMAAPDGRRLGQGGGYYDRFLPRCRCPAVLLCPSALVQNDLPAESHDHRADLVLTEQGFLLEG